MKTIAAQSAPSGSAPTSADDYFSIYAIADLSTHGLAALSAGYPVYPTVLVMPIPAATPAGTDVSEAVTYGLPSPLNSSRFGLEYDAFVVEQVPLTAAATSACANPTALQGYLVYEQFGAFTTSAIVPQIHPVGNATTNNLPSTSGWGITGVPVQVSWTAPSGSPNPPTDYLAVLYQLGVDSSCKTTLNRLGTIRTAPSQLSVQMPPSFFATQDGSAQYFVDVIAYWLPDEPDLTTPYRFFNSARAAYAEKFTVTFTH